MSGIIVVWLPPDTLALFRDEMGKRLTLVEARRLIMRLDVIEQRGGGGVPELGLSFENGDEAYALKRSLDNALAMCAMAETP